MLDFELNYPAWREHRLAAWPKLDQLSFVDIENPRELSTNELSMLQQHCGQTNFACYRIAEAIHADKESIRAMVEQLNMHPLDHNLCADNDSISTLKMMDLEKPQGYIPYTNKPLNWHTDGYYNPMQEHIRSFLLHCAQSAESGGENMLLNHELLYIQLQDEDPNLVHALMQADALTIPANFENGVEIRPAQTGPVFYRDPKSKTLQMRYTARSRSIEWKKDILIERATKLITDFLNHDPSVLRLTLRAGEGIICNNILHGRTAFTNTSLDKERIFFRARSYNRLFS